MERLIPREDYMAWLESFRDNHPKYILTMDPFFVEDHGWVRTYGVLDFLRGDVDL